MNEVLRAIRNRRSLRRFKPDPLPEEALKAILEAGLQAPTGHNDQPWFLSVVLDQALLREISDGGKAAMRTIPVPWIAELGKNEKFQMFYGAPAVVFVSARKDAVSPLADVCAAIQNMLLASESLGIGSCWIGFAKFYFTGPDRLAQLGIPESHEVHYGVALGFRPDGLVLNPPDRKFEHFYRIIR
ncbi:MAG: nitroreductase [Candidatus Aminicenantes bacterium]|nr:nitroreductase [Candidatus Aminicenantes bacterium]